MRGTIVSIVSGACRVDTGREVYKCAARGRLTQSDTGQSKPLVVGDQVEFDPTGKNEGVVTKSLPRRTKLSRARPRHPYIEHVIAANVDRLLMEATRSRPELAAALARIEAKRAEVKATRARYWPTITANASAGRKDTTFLPDREEWSAGVGLRFPLFTGFGRSHQLRRARAELARAAAEHSDLVRGVELEVWTAYWQIIEAGEAIEAARELVASAEESAHVAEGEYKSGAGSVIGVIDAQAARTAAKTRFVQARLDWYTAKARFERAVGRMFAQEGAASAFRKVRN